MPISSIDKSLAEVTQSVLSLENNPDELRRYLDMLEASIVEVPHGDLLHEHACELVAAIMQNSY